MNNPTITTPEEACKFMAEYRKTALEYSDGVPVDDLPDEFWQSLIPLLIEAIEEEIQKQDSRPNLCAAFSDSPTLSGNVTSV